MKEIIFDFGDFIIDAELNESPTSQALYDQLPIDGVSQIWGDEIYFSTSISMENDEWAKETVELGDIAFCPPGSAICLFFGETAAGGLTEDDGQVLNNGGLFFEKNK